MRIRYIWKDILPENPRQGTMRRQRAREYACEPIAEHEQYEA